MMSANGAEISEEMKKVLEEKGFSAVAPPANGMLRSALATEVANRLAATAPRECVEQKVKDLVDLYHVLARSGARSAIRRLDGRARYWLSDKERDADPELSDIICPESAEFASQPPASPPAAAAVGTTSVTGIADEILKFKKLLDVGALTDAEFEQAKKRLLDSM